MHEITRILLENEMDVILAHKRSIRLAELAGLSISGQTTFATAVSEVSRSAMEPGVTAQLVLCVERTDERQQFLVAQVRNAGGSGGDGYTYARRLVSNITVTQGESDSNIELRFRIPATPLVTAELMSRWVTVFENDLPSSPYEEIKRKNRQLADLAEKLQASEAQYRTLSETVPLFIFRWEQERGMTFVNQWARDFTGSSQEDLLHSDWSDIIYPEDYPRVRAMWEEFLPQGAPVHSQFRVRRASDGAYIWHLSKILPQTGGTGDTGRWVGFLVDIHAQKLVEQTLQDNTELKAVQHQLETHKQELEEHVLRLNRSNEELERFAFVASHDLQEPLRKILVYGDIMGQKPELLADKAVGHAFGRLMGSARHMKQLIHDLLSFSTVTQEKSPAHKPVDLNTVVANVLTELDMAIQEKGAALQVDSLPVVSGSASQLQQLFANLIRNSLKYARPEVPPVIRLHSRQDEEGMNVITLEDNGIGFESQYRERIFTLFQRLHNRDRYEGTGIGLTICRRIAELHGGSVTANGVLDQGAVFTIALPVPGFESPRAAPAMVR